MADHKHNPVIAEAIETQETVRTLASAAVRMAAWAASKGAEVAYMLEGHEAEKRRAIVIVLSGDVDDECFRQFAELVRGWNQDMHGSRVHFRRVEGG